MVDFVWFLCRGVFVYTVVLELLLMILIVILEKRVSLNQNQKKKPARQDFFWYKDS